jgi:hypothetical protein
MEYSGPGKEKTMLLNKSHTKKPTDICSVKVLGFQTSGIALRTSAIDCRESNIGLLASVDHSRRQEYRRKRLHAHLRFLLTFVLFCGFRSKTKNPPFGGSVMVGFGAIQKLYIALSSASISRDRFLSPSRVSILWTLFRSRVKSSIAIFRLCVGEFWSGLLSCENTIAARLRYSIEKAKAFKLGHYPMVPRLRDKRLLC